MVRFTRQGTTWTSAGTIAPDSTIRPAAFGSSLARDGGDLLVGAPLVNMSAGAVHVFRRESSEWRQKQLLVTPPAGFSTRLGATLAASGGLAVAGAPLADFFEGTGLLYQRDGNGAWRQTAAVTDSITAVLPAVAGGEVKCQGGKARGFECKDASLVAFMPNGSIGAKRGTLLNGIWGWTDSTTGREFALVGRTDGTSFVEVTDPANPKYLGDLPLHQGARPNIWREIKVYRTHAFIVADGAGPHGMQIFDLTQLRSVSSPQTFRETAHYAGINSAHNIVINPASGFAYVAGASMGGETCGGSLHMVDVREPLQSEVRRLLRGPRLGLQRTGYTHDAQCVIYQGPDADYHGREICLTASETGLGVADVTDKARPRTISIATYPNVSYAHQGWLTDDHRYFFLDDEGDELIGTAPKTRTVVFDLADLEDPVVATEFYGTTAATDHNLYVNGRYMYQSNYVAGLRVVDVKDPVNPVEVGYFDTVPFGENLPGLLGVVEQLSILQERHRGGEQHARGSVPGSLSAEHRRPVTARFLALAALLLGTPAPLAAQLYVPNQDDATVSVDRSREPAAAAHGGPPPLRRGRQRQAASRPGGAGRERLVRHADRGGEGPQARPQRPGAGQRRDGGAGTHRAAPVEGPDVRGPLDERGEPAAADGGDPAIRHDGARRGGSPLSPPPRHRRPSQGRCGLRRQPRHQPDRQRRRGRG